MSTALKDHLRVPSERFPVQRSLWSLAFGIMLLVSAHSDTIAQTQNSSEVEKPTNATQHQLRHEHVKFFRYYENSKPETEQFIQVLENLAQHSISINNLTEIAHALDQLFVRNGEEPLFTATDTWNFAVANNYFQSYFHYLSDLQIPIFNPELIVSEATALQASGTLEEASQQITTQTTIFDGQIMANIPLPHFTIQSELGVVSVSFSLSTAANSRRVGTTQLTTTFTHADIQQTIADHAGATTYDLAEFPGITALRALRAQESKDCIPVDDGVTDTDRDGFSDSLEVTSIPVTITAETFSGSIMTSDTTLDGNPDAPALDPCIPDIIVSTITTEGTSDEAAEGRLQKSTGLSLSEALTLTESFAQEGIALHIDNGSESPMLYAPEVTRAVWGQLSNARTIPFTASLLDQLLPNQQILIEEKAIEVGFSEMPQALVDANWKLALYVHRIDPSRISGTVYSRPFLNPDLGTSQYFIVSAELTNSLLTSSSQLNHRMVTTAHELGHTLGLSHGGFHYKITPQGLVTERDLYSNYGVLHFSVMNYAYTSLGIPYGAGFVTTYHQFNPAENFQIATEQSILDDTAPIFSEEVPYSLIYPCPDGGSYLQYADLINNRIDWNCNGQQDLAVPQPYHYETGTYTSTNPFLVGRIYDLTEVGHAQHITQLDEWSRLNNLGPCRAVGNRDQTCTGLMQITPKFDLSVDPLHPLTLNITNFSLIARETSTKTIPVSYAWSLNGALFSTDQHPTPLNLPRAGTYTISIDLASPYQTATLSQTYTASYYYHLPVIRR
jgi:hypothetical protein